MAHTDIFSLSSSVGWKFWILFGCGLVVVFLWAFLLSKIQDHRMRSILNDWARENKYQIINTKHRFLAPFWGRGHQFFYITVLDSNGQQKERWFKCGLNLIIFYQRSEVIWKK
jgi:hypothetical protein